MAMQCANVMEMTMALLRELHAQIELLGDRPTGPPISIALPI